MIELSRETVAVLAAAGMSVLPTLVVYGKDAQAWQLSEALSEAEAALVHDQDDGARGNNETA